MTEAYAIKAPDGEILEIRLDGQDGLLREKWALQLARGYKCVPVTVSEKGDKCVTNLTQNEYDALVRDAMLHRVSEKGDAGSGSTPTTRNLRRLAEWKGLRDEDKQVCLRAADELDAYLSRGQG